MRSIPAACAIALATGCVGLQDEQFTGQLTRFSDSRWFVLTLEAPNRKGRIIEVSPSIWNIEGIRGEYVLKYRTAETTEADLAQAADGLCSALRRPVADISARRALRGFNRGSSSVDIRCGPMAA